MHNYNLGFISDEDIYNHVKKTVEAYRREITLDQFNQTLLSLGADGWVVNKNGTEIENKRKNIYARLLKDANESTIRKACISMQGKLLDDNSYTCYLIDTTEETCIDEPWVVEIENKPWSHPHIRRISLHRFHDLILNDYKDNHQL